MEIDEIWTPTLQRSRILSYYVTGDATIIVRRKLTILICVTGPHCGRMRFDL